MEKKNHSISLKTQINRRLSLKSDFDRRRREANHHRIEGFTKLSYDWPALTRFFNGDMSFSFSRKRFTSFDADIWRISPQIRKQFTKIFSGAAKYQFERIRQFDATELKDQETFKIGSIISSIEFDLRDNSINPRSGSFFCSKLGIRKSIFSF